MHHLPLLCAVAFLAEYTIATGNIYLYPQSPSINDSPVQGLMKRAVNPKEGLLIPWIFPTPSLLSSSCLKTSSERIMRKCSRKEKKCACRRARRLDRFGVFLPAYTQRLCRTFPDSRSLRCNEKLAAYVQGSARRGIICSIPTVETNKWLRQQGPIAGWLSDEERMSNKPKRFNIPFSCIWWRVFLCTRQLLEIVHALLFAMFFLSASRKVPHGEWEGCIDLVILHFNWAPVQYKMRERLNSFFVFLGLVVVVTTFALDWEVKEKYVSKR